MFRTRTLMITAVIATLTVGALSGSAQSATISGLFNTGVDASRNPLADGSADTHYQLNGGNTPVVFTHQAYLSVADARFIAAQAGGGHTINPNSYSLLFDLTGLDPATATISGNLAGDNGATVFLNKVFLATTPGFDTSAAFQTFTPFSASTGFLPGINTLLFIVLDGPSGPPSAFIVSGLTGSAEFAQSAVPLPAAAPLFAGAVAVAGLFGYRRKRKAATA